MKFCTQLEDIFEKMFGYRGIADSSCGGMACNFNVNGVNVFMSLIITV